MFFVRRGFPLSRCAGLRHDLDRLFRELQPGFGELWPLNEHAFPALNVWEDEEHLHVEADVPGFKMEDLEVSVLGDELTIRGRREPSDEDRSTFHLRERRTSEFVRTLTLPVEVDADKIEATLKDGVLAVVMPKAEAARMRKIEVKGG